MENIRDYKTVVEEAASMVEDVVTNAMTPESEKLLMTLARLIAFTYRKGPYDVASDIGRVLREVAIQG